MSQRHGRHAWRTSLCKYGPNCQIYQCSRAHTLCQLRSPDEGSEQHDSIWHDGVDRWCGQELSREQIKLLLRYYHETPFYMVPPWMHGLLYVIRAQNYVEHLHMPWDYGLCEDIEFLKRYRRGRVPFVYMAYLWEDLHERRNMLELEQTVPEKFCRGIQKEV